MSAPPHPAIAIVTGAGHGIGAATADRLAADGAGVVVADLDGDAAQRRVQAITAAGGTAVAAVGDVTTDAGVAHITQTCLDHLGAPTVVVNNVGHHRSPVPFAHPDSTPERWRDLLDVNAWHVLAVTKAVLEPMIDAGGGAIVNVASVEGIRGFPRDPVYAAWKAAVVAFTRSLAAEVGRHDIRVNAVAPDVTESAQVPYSSMLTDAEAAEGWARWTPLGRPVDAADVAATIAFLASDAARSITGAVVPVDAGTLAASGWVRPTSPEAWTNRP